MPYPLKTFCEIDPVALEGVTMLRRVGFWHGLLDYCCRMLGSQRLFNVDGDTVSC